MSAQDDHGVIDPADHPELFRIDKGHWAQAWKVALVLGVVGWIGAGVGAAGDPRRFAFSYLFAFMVFMVFGLGGLFFVIVQHLANANWSASVRRSAEFVTLGLPVLAILWVPIWVTRDHLYEWSAHANEAHREAGEHGGEHGDDHGPGHEEGHGDEHGRSGESLLAPSTAQAQDHGGGAAGDHGGDHAAGGEHEGEGDHAHSGPQHELHGELLAHKAPYLNVPFWTLRAVFYFVVWTLLALAYFRWSTKQDETKDPALTRRMAALAPIAMLLFGLTLTFAAFDWVMSLEPTWYSTIYGVTVFASGAVSIHAFVILVTLGWKRAGLLGNAVNAEHYHDLGKLMFGFIVFWAYVCFSQMMLIWYAGIPEEAAYYHLRWNNGGWATYSLVLLVGHFIFPFLLIISRVMKRRFAVIGFAAAWMLGMTVVNAYWYVLPVYEPGRLVFHVLDVACLLAVGGTFLAVVTWAMQRYPLIPLGDPRLPRALHFENA